MGSLHRLELMVWSNQNPTCNQTVIGQFRHQGTPCPHQEVLGRLWGWWSQWTRQSLDTNKWVKFHFDWSWGLILSNHLFPLFIDLQEVVKFLMDTNSKPSSSSRDRRPRGSPPRGYRKSRSRSPPRGSDIQNSRTGKERIHRGRLPTLGDLQPYSRPRSKSPQPPRRSKSPRPRSRSPRRKRSISPDRGGR